MHCIICSRRANAERRYRIRSAPLRSFLRQKREENENENLMAEERRALAQRRAKIARSIVDRSL